MNKSHNYTKIQEYRLNNIEKTREWRLKNKEKIMSYSTKYRYKKTKGIILPTEVLETIVLINKTKQLCRILNN